MIKKALFSLFVLENIVMGAIAFFGAGFIFGVIIDEDHEIKNAIREGTS